MATFTDTEGREWTVALSIGLARRIRDAAGVDLLKDDKLSEEIGRLAGDVELLVNALWICCAEQAERREVDEESFAGALGGDALDQAADALMEALVNFTRSFRREATAAALKRIKQIQNKAGQRALQVIEGPEMERYIEDELNRAGGGLSGSSPESSGSSRAA